MKKLYLIQFLFLSFILFSCHSKPEKKEQRRVEYTIQNYKMDDDELTRRKTETTKADKPIKEKKLPNSKIRTKIN